MGVAAHQRNAVLSGLLHDRVTGISMTGDGNRLACRPQPAWPRLHRRNADALLRTDTSGLSAAPSQAAALLVHAAQHGLSVACLAAAPIAEAGTFPLQASLARLPVRGPSWAPVLHRGRHRLRLVRGLAGRGSIAGCAGRWRPFRRTSCPRHVLLRPHRRNAAELFSWTGQAVRGLPGRSPIAGTLPACSSTPAPNVRGLTGRGSIAGGRTCPSHRTQSELSVACPAATPSQDRWRGLALPGP